MQTTVRRIRAQVGAAIERSRRRVETRLAGLVAPTARLDSADEAAGEADGAGLRRRTLLRRVGAGTIIGGAAGGAGLYITGPTGGEPDPASPRGNTDLYATLASAGLTDAVVDVTAERTLVRYNAPAGEPIERSAGFVMVAAVLAVPGADRIVLEVYEAFQKRETVTASADDVRAFVDGTLSAAELSDRLRRTPAGESVVLPPGGSDGEAGGTARSSMAGAGVGVATVPGSRGAAAPTGVADRNGETVGKLVCECGIGKKLQDEKTRKLLKEMAEMVKQGVVQEAALNQLEAKLAQKVGQKLASRLVKVISTASTAMNVVSLLLSMQNSLGGPCGKCLVWNTATGDGYVETVCQDTVYPPPCKPGAPEDGIPVVERCIGAWEEPEGRNKARPSAGEIRIEADDEGNPARAILYVNCEEWQTADNPGDVPRVRVETRCPTESQPAGSVSYETDEEGHAIKVLYKRSACNDEVTVCTPSLQYRENEDGSISTDEYRNVDGDKQKERLVYGNGKCDFVLRCPPSLDKNGQRRLVQIVKDGKLQWVELVYDPVECETKYKCPPEGKSDGDTELVERYGKVIRIKYDDFLCDDESYSAGNLEDTLRSDRFRTQVETGLNEAPDRIANVVADKRLNLRITTDDGSTRRYGLELDGRSVAAVGDPFQPPDLVVVTDEETIRDIANAGNPRRTAALAFKQGRIRLRSPSVVEDLQVAVAERTARAGSKLDGSPYDLDVGESTDLTFRGGKATMTKNELGYRTVEPASEAAYDEMVPERTGGWDAGPRFVVDEVGAVEGVTTGDCQRLIGTDPSTLSRTAGVYGTGALGAMDAAEPAFSGTRY